MLNHDSIFLNYPKPQVQNYRKLDKIVFIAHGSHGYCTDDFEDNNLDNLFQQLARQSTPCRAQAQTRVAGQMTSDSCLCKA